MNQLDISKVEFYQNPEKLKTVAVLNGCTYDAWEEFIQSSGNTVNHNIMSYCDVPEEFLLPYTIKVISTCHHSDRWDPEVGKYQAYYKLLRSYNKMKSRAVTRGIKYFNNKIIILNKLVNHYDSNSSYYDKLVRNPRRSNNSGV